MLEGGKGLWSLPTLRAATSDQNGHLPGRPWGLGWAVRGQSISCKVPSRFVWMLVLLLLAAFRGPSDCDSWLSACVFGDQQTTPSYGSDGGLIRPGKITCQLGDLLSSASFGHTGSVGSVAWCDPVTEMVCVICSVRAVRTGEEPTICGACCYAAGSFVGLVAITA